MTPATIVLVNQPSPTTASRRGTGLAVALGLVGIAAFEVALAAGAPWGKAAWGGRTARLSTGLRVASGIVAPLYVVAAATVAQQAGLVDAHLRPEIARKATSMLSGYLFVGSALNWMSPSRLERFIWGPITLALAILCRAVAKSDPQRN